MAKDHVMIDIEALGLIYGAVVASIGLVRFDPYAGVQPAEKLAENGDAICINVDIDDAIKQGMSVDGDTLKWWFMQSEEAQRETFLKTPAVSQAIACQTMTRFFSGSRNGFESKVWCNGANFDNILLEAMLTKSGYSVPWKFYNVRCFRTLKSLVAYDKNMVPVNPLKHSALADAIHQTQTLQAISWCNRSLMI